MIPIPFGYTGNNQFNLSKYQYVEGADIIFDFGNPITTGSVAGSGYASNVITEKSSVQMSLTSQNPGGKPTLGGANVGGTLDFLFTGNPYVVWNYGLTAAQTTIVFFKPDNFLTVSGMPAAGNNEGLNKQNALEMDTSLIGGEYYVSSSVFDAGGNPHWLFNVKMDKTSYGGWTMAALSTNGTNLHQFWQNNATGSTSTYSMTRGNSSSDPKTFGKLPLIDAGISGQLMAFMQYPRQLNQREIKQTFQLFKQRLT